MNRLQLFYPLDQARLSAKIYRAARVVAAVAISVTVRKRWASEQQRLVGNPQAKNVGTRSLARRPEEGPSPILNRKRIQDQVPSLTVVAAKSQ